MRLVRKRSWNTMGRPLRWLPLVVLCAVACGPPRASTVLDPPPQDPTVYGEVADFALTERGGEEVTLADLRGRPWIASFFFTSCPGPCPVLIANVRRMQEALDGHPTRLVSVTVDPENDTLERLASYAESFTADPEQWLFLRGDEAETYQWMRDSFALAVEKLPGDAEVSGHAITHATRLIVVDADGRIRGYYDGETDEGLSGALGRALHLERAGFPWPRLNASLNGVAALLLVLGLVAIKRGRREAHGRIMRAAFLVSAAFLACYLYYHFAVAAKIGPTRYNGRGWDRTAYLALLLSHTVLAVVNLPMVLRTLWLAHKERWEAHARLAKWTFPIWLYVSVTGVLVYLVLYHWNPLPVLD